MEHDVLAEVVRDEALRQEGVAHMDVGCIDKLRKRKVPGVTTHLDRDNWLHVDIAIVAARGSDLHSLGAAVQQAAIAAIRKDSDRRIGRVNVHVAYPAKETPTPLDGAPSVGAPSAS